MVDRLLGLAPRALSAPRYWRAIAWMKARLEAAQAPQPASVEEPDGDDVFAALRRAVG